jgi:hypothetical protein
MGKTLQGKDAPAERLYGGGGMGKTLQGKDAPAERLYGGMTM